MNFSCLHNNFLNGLKRNYSLINNHAFTFNFYQDYLYILQDYLNKILNLLLVQLLLVNTMLQDSFTNIMAVISFQEDQLQYKNNSIIRRLRHVSEK